MNNLQFIKDHNINKITPLLKGWSKDKKYILENSIGDKFLIRISSKELFDIKKLQFEQLKLIDNLGIYCPKPIEFGRLPDESIYMILSYLVGEDAINVVSGIPTREAYQLGVEAGIVLKKIHDIPIYEKDWSWWDRYQEKMPKKINALLNCEYRIPMHEELIRYYKDNCHLMKNRPLRFVHGDYHLGNMVVNNGKIGIIDFDKNGIADPYDDFKPFCWNVMRSEYFETGLINGYFNNRVPNEFFAILKYYTIESMISHLPWAVVFGKQEIDTAYHVIECQMQWWNSFTLDLPLWYKGIE